MTHRVTLIAPGLLDPVPYLDKIPSKELPELPCLSNFFSRGRFSSANNPDTSPNNFYQFLYKCISSDNTNVSIANFSFLAEQSNGKIKLEDVEQRKWMLRAEPAFLSPDRDQLVLNQYDDPGLSMTEANQLVEEINQFFQTYKEEDFWKLYALTPQRWYIISDKAINIETIPPEKVLGQSLKAHLLKGQDSQHWLNLFNEFQMILHQSSINSQRIKNNKIPVNSLWLWGSGRPIQDEPGSQSERFSKIYSNNIYVQGLSKFKNIEFDSFSEKYEDIAEKEQQSILYVMESLEKNLQNQDLYSWVQRLKQLDNEFFQPIANELKSGRLSQLEIISPTGTKLFITRKLLRRWWRKKNSFYDILK